MGIQHLTHICSAELKNPEPRAARPLLPNQRCQKVPVPSVVAVNRCWRYFSQGIRTSFNLFCGWQRIL